MIYDNKIINIDILKVYLNDLIKEKENFENISYNIFKNSYINNISDTFIKNVSTKLESLYKEIEHDYMILIKWFNDYLQNIYSLELYLSSEGNLGSINESELRNYTSCKLPNLDIYTNE